MDRTLAKLTNDLLNWQQSQKRSYSPFKSKQITECIKKINHHLHVHYKFQKSTQTDLGL